MCFPFNTMSLWIYNECICAHCFFSIDEWFPLYDGFLIDPQDKYVGWLGLGITPLVLAQPRVKQFSEMFTHDLELISWKLKTNLLLNSMTILIRIISTLERGLLFFVLFSLCIFLIFLISSM